MLDRALKASGGALLVALALFLGSLTLFGVVGFSLFPRSEKPMFLVNIETPIGTNLYKTDSIARYAEQVVLRQPKIKAVYSNVGKGNPACTTTRSNATRPATSRAALRAHGTGGPA